MLICNAEGTSHEKCNISHKKFTDTGWVGVFLPERSFFFFFFLQAPGEVVRTENLG